jgi:membrane protein implicated in regulation of membrane protease activity
MKLKYVILIAICIVAIIGGIIATAMIGKVWFSICMIAYIAIFSYWTVYLWRAMVREIEMDKTIKPFKSSF